RRGSLHCLQHALSGGAAGNLLASAGLCLQSVLSSLPGTHCARFRRADGPWPGSQPPENGLSPEPLDGFHFCRDRRRAWLSRLRRYSALAWLRRLPRLSRRATRARYLRRAVGNWLCLLDCCAIFPQYRLGGGAHPVYRRAPALRQLWRFLAGHHHGCRWHLIEYFAVLSTRIISTRSIIRKTTRCGY